jgi:hypothetical protein
MLRRALEESLGSDPVMAGPVGSAANTPAAAAAAAHNTSVSFDATDLDTSVMSMV